MIPIRIGRLALAGCLLSFSLACDSSSGAGGAAGSAGTGGAGGAGGSDVTPLVAPGLWQGASNGIETCLFVSEDGLRLTPSSACNVTGAAESDARAFDARVELVGRDQDGQACSLELPYSADVAIDPLTGAFGVSGISSSTGATLSFSGEISTLYASGVAQSESAGSTCRVGWEAIPTASCTEEAIQSCLDLQDCCRAILINPVFFQSCNQIVLECDQAQCLQVLAGYPRCTEL